MKRQSVGIRRLNEEGGSSQNNETKRLKVFHSQELLHEAVSGSDTDEEYANFGEQEKQLSSSVPLAENLSNPTTEKNGIVEDQPNGSYSAMETDQGVANTFTNGNTVVNGKDHLVISEASAFETYSEQNQPQSVLAYPEDSAGLDVQGNLTPEILQQIPNNPLNFSSEMQIPNLNDRSESDRYANYGTYANVVVVQNGNEARDTTINPNAYSENMHLNLDDPSKASFGKEFYHDPTSINPLPSEQNANSYYLQTEVNQQILTPSSNDLQHEQQNLASSHQSEPNQQSFASNQSSSQDKQMLDSSFGQLEKAQPSLVSACLSESVKPGASSQLSEEINLDLESPLVSKIDVENITFCELKVTQLEGHADVVFCVDIDEDYIVSSSGDTTVKVWNVEEKKVISNFAGHNASVTSVVLLTKEQSTALGTKLNISNAERIAVSASYDCHVRLWSVLDGHEIASMYTFNSITCMGYLPDQMYVVVGTEGGKLEVWDLCLAKIVHFMYAHESALTSLKVHDCYIYTTSKDGAVKVWLFEEEELQPLYTRRRREKTVGACASYFGPTQWQAVSIHNDLLFLGDSTCRLKVLDWRLGRLRVLVNQPDEDGICESTLTKNNILLSTFYSPSSDTGGMNVWLLPDMTYVGTLTGDLQEICSLALVEVGQKLRIVSGGHQLLVWDFDFSKPPNKNAKDPFFVCEVENVGSEFNEESVSRVIPVQQHQSPSAEVCDSKKSWCNIS